MKRHVSTVINPNKAAIAESPFRMLVFDNIYKILENVDVHSFFHFKFTCRYMNAILSEKESILVENKLQIRKDGGCMQYETLERINMHLNEMGILDSCTKFLNDLSAVIAGSFPLMHMHNLFWKRSDIDIFVPALYAINDEGLKIKLNLKEAQDVIKQIIFHYFPMITRIAALQTSSYMMLSEFDDNYEDNGVYILNCYYRPPKEYYHKYKRYTNLEFIFTGYTDVKNYINTNFDLSICKIYTDLKNVHCYNYKQQTEMIGYMHENPFTHTNDKRIIATHENRIKKYEKRGFKILRYDDRESELQ